MKRVQAKIHLTQPFDNAPQDTYAARLILNDLGPQSVTVFSTRPLELGQPVSLEITHPRPLQVKGKVTYAALFEITSKVHNTLRYPYRIQVEFDFLNDGEAAAVREYVEDLVRNELSKAA